MSRIQILPYLFGIFMILSCHSARAGGLLKIIGGNKADENQFPYQVVLETYSITFCGGSILSKRFVITAAHCVIKKDGSFKNYPIKVIAGINDLKSESQNKVKVDVIEVYVPKEYDPTTIYKYETGDIAVLELNEDLSIRFNPKLGTVELPKKGGTYDGVEATISGFGYSEIKVVTDRRTGISEEKGKSPDEMRFATAKVVSFEDCQRYYILAKIGKKHICAGVVQQNGTKPEGVCSGDSGGPLVYRGIQIGVLSNNPFGCREDTRPAVYTRVSEFLGFIEKVVAGDTDDSIRTTKLKIRA